MPEPKNACVQQQGMVMVVMVVVLELESRPRMQMDGTACTRACAATAAQAGGSAKAPGSITPCVQECRQEAAPRCLHEYRYMS